MQIKHATAGPSISFNLSRRWSSEAAIKLRYDEITDNPLRYIEVQITLCSMDVELWKLKFTSLYQEFRYGEVRYIDF